MKTKLQLLMAIFALMLISVSVSNALPSVCTGGFNTNERTTHLVLNNKTIITSATSTSYNDMRTIVLEVEAGSTMQFLSEGYTGDPTGGPYGHYIAIYCDFNKDADFKDDDNEVLFRDGKRANKHEGEVLIPEDIDGGEYLLRYVNSYSLNYDAYRYGCGGGTWGQVFDFILKVKPKQPTFMDIYPKIVEGTDIPIFARGNVFSVPFVDIKRAAGQPEVTMEYKIIGPLPYTTEIYRATAEGNINQNIITPNPQPIGEPGRYMFTHAKGPASNYFPNDPEGPQNNGVFNLKRDASSIPGGKYTAVGQMHMTVKGLPHTETIERDFIIALENDLAITRVSRPRAKGTYKYPVSSPVSREFTVTNVGLNPISTFKIKSTIYKGTSTTPAEPTSERIITSTPALVTGASKPVEFNTFNVTKYGIGDYRCVYEVEIIGGAADDNLVNNSFPALGSSDQFLFEVSYEYDAEPIALLEPSGINYVSRPLKLRAQYQNNGTMDLTAVPTKIEVRDPNGVLVHEDSTSIDDIPSHPIYNKMSNFFPKEFVPNMVGVFTVKIVTVLKSDELKTNNETTASFSVNPSMTGEYTIGMKNSGKVNNFPTFEAAMNRIYVSGLVGPLTFILTDEVYNVGDKTELTKPALDLSSRIIGVNSTNTITFKPSQERAVTKAGVTINLKSGNGMGVYIAQNISPTHEVAAIFNATDDNVKFYANSKGYIKFDGGSQKSIKFVLDTDSPFKAAFYLGNGASNNTIQNCIIDGGAAPTYLSNLPGSIRQAGNVYFQENKRTNTSTYTAAIVMRSKAPWNARTKSNTTHFLDTVSNNYNMIKNNEISGFAYGVASMGVGYLFRANGTNKDVAYYNKGNVVANNKIYNVGRAAIFMGFEDGSVIKSNRIYKVGGMTDEDANGILLGGRVNDNSQGYNVLNMEVTGNEISNLKSSVALYGIRVEQSPLLISVNGTTTIFPLEAEASKITSNVIWEMMAENATGILPNKENVDRFGIMIRTERKKGSSMLTPANIHYSSRNDVIANNTILMTGDDLVMHKAPQAAIAVQQTKTTMIKNNAIAMLDREVAADNNINAAILYQGTDFETSGFVSDRNVYWTENNSTSIFRMIKTDAATKTVYAGTRSEYTDLNQWQTWTNQDSYSKKQNFLSDLVYVGNHPMNLRIKSNPYPLNSPLNNHGDILSMVTNDLNGISRGVAGQRFDIGAFEFNGRQSISDLGVMKIVAPAAYKSNMGERFSDAEYIMTEAPIDVTVRIRNNGSLQQTGSEATVKIYRENPDGTFAASPMLTAKSNVSLVSSEEIDLSFGLDNGTSKFIPQTYSDLRLDVAYKTAVPEEYKHMTANVTPRYKIEVILAADEDNRNNMITKNVRFFIRKSWNYLLVSSDFVGSAVTATTPKNVIAGSLNHSALAEGLEAMGWKVVIDPAATSISDDRVDYDVLDRQNWEPRAVKYPIYRTLLWSDNHDQKDVAGNMENVVLSYFSQENIKTYLNSGAENDKKNFMVGSQEMLRNNDAKFVNPILRGSERAANPLIDRTKISGAGVGTSLTNKLKMNTGIAGDVDADPTLLNIFTEGEGISKAAYYYTSVKPGEKEIPEAEKLMAVATTTIKTNRAYLGVDWRHFADLEQVLRQTFDFIETNGGIVFPIELISFDANKIGNRVNISWSTASEKNSSHFEVERSEFNEAGQNYFTTIESVDAAGNSGSRLDYNINDARVELGKTYIYRLKLVETDGSIEYSDERTVELSGNVNITVGQVQPNPVSSTSTLSIELDGNAKVQADIFDIQGVKVLSVTDKEESAGTFTLDIKSNSLQSGAYMLVVRIGDTIIRRHIRVVK